MDIKADYGRAAGNKECIQLLRQWLREAKKGKMSHVAMAIALEPNLMYTQSVGSIAFQPDICDALDALRHKIKNMIDDRWAPIDPNVTADHVTFSTSAHNVGFDFVPWIISAEMNRVRKNAPAPLKVAFYGKQQPGVSLPDIQIQMMRNVIGPLVQAIGGEVDKVVGGRGDFSITCNEIVAAAKAGETVPKFRAPPLAAAAMDALLDGIPQPVTITLREAKHYTNRNSNMEAWLKFAKDLVAKGEEVIFVRDTAKAEEELENFSTMPVASQNTHMRIALYERAKFNLFVANGPATLNWHLDTPFLFFSEMDPDHKNTYEPCWPEWWPRRMGIEAGEQFPWFNPRQKIVWQQDTYENISAAWEAAHG